MDAANPSIPSLAVALPAVSAAPVGFGSVPVLPLVPEKKVEQVYSAKLHLLGHSPVLVCVLPAKLGPDKKEAAQEMHYLQYLTITLN